jgi:hypothetical protein
MIWMLLGVSCEILAAGRLKRLIPHNSGFEGRPERASKIRNHSLLVSAQKLLSLRKGFKKRLDCFGSEVRYIEAGMKKGLPAFFPFAAGFPY